MSLCVFFRDSSDPGSAVWARWRRGHPGPGGWRSSYWLPCQRWTHTATQGCSRPPPYSPAGKHLHMLESFHTAVCLWKVMILHVLCNKKRKNINLEQGVYLARWIFALKVTLYSLHLRCCISKQAKARTKRPSHSAIHTHPHTICKQITLLFDSAREKERR